MTAKQLQKKYPSFWKIVSDEIRDDIIYWQNYHDVKFSPLCKKGLAFNAAFIATMAHHTALQKLLKNKKPVDTGR